MSPSRFEVIFIVDPEVIFTLVPGLLLLQSFLEKKNTQNSISLYFVV